MAVIAKGVTEERKVNGKPLSADIVLGAGDVGALPRTGGVATGPISVDNGTSGVGLVSAGGTSHKAAMGVSVSVGEVLFGTADGSNNIVSYLRVGNTAKSLKFLPNAESPQYEVFHRGNNPAASDITGIVGSLSSGAVIESGSNANGEYVKFADGTMICASKMSFSSPVSGPMDGLQYAAYRWTFPASFIASPSVSGSFRSAGRLILSVGYRDESVTSSAELYYGSLNPIADGTTILCRLIAIGRWK